MRTEHNFHWLILPPGIALVAWIASGGTDAAALLLATGASLGIFAGGWFLGRRRSPRGTRPQYGDKLRVLQSLRLSPQHTIHAVRYEETTLLVGASGNRMAVLPTTGRQGEERLRDPDLSGDGVDLRDTPRTQDELPAQRPPNLAESRTRTGRSALMAANLSEFRARLQDARKTQV